jgi:hypothetical protein
MNIDHTGLQYNNSLTFTQVLLLRNEAGYILALFSEEVTHDVTLIMEITELMLCK